MTPSLSKREANRQRWFDCIETWQHSGLTQKTFCEQQQLRLGSFLRWRGISMRQRKLPVSSALTFLPVNISTPRPPSLALLFDDDLRIEIPVGFDPVTFIQVVRAVKAR